MIDTRADALAVIFPNTYDELIPEASHLRLMASIPFASRYRIIDFLLSSLVNGGVDNVAIIVKKNYHSLVDHLGAGKEWDLSRKNGGLNIFPPYSREGIGVYRDWIQALESIRDFLTQQREEYVILTDCYIAMNFDFQDLIQKHMASGADITVVYKKEPIPRPLMELDDPEKGHYYTLDVDGDKVSGIHINPKDKGVQNVSMNIYIVGREWLINTIRDAYVHGLRHFLRDVVGVRVDQLDVRGYEYTGYTARILDRRSYLEENMKLLDDANRDALFAGNRIYTKVRDDTPTRYVGDSSAENVMVADGCVIEGEIKNSILFRGVKIGRGAKVSNCILMQDTVVEENAEIDRVIADKRARISAGVELKGTAAFPIYISKAQEV